MYPTISRAIHRNAIVWLVSDHCRGRERQSTVTCVLRDDTYAVSSNSVPEGNGGREPDYGESRSPVATISHRLHPRCEDDDICSYWSSKRFQPVCSS